MVRKVTVSAEELTMIVNALENREFKYSMIKDIHSYLLHKIDECDKVAADLVKDDLTQQKSDLES